MTETEYLLQCLQEECAEVIQAASKCNRFTIYCRHPGGMGNLEKLNREINDVSAIITLLCENDIYLGWDSELIAKKREKVKEFMSVSRTLGVIKDEPPP